MLPWQSSSVTSRTNVIHQAREQGFSAIREIGRELRIARMTSGRTQLAVARTAGCSQSRISRVEAGRVSRIGVVELAMIAAAVGLRVWARAYPAGRRPLDAPQLRLLARFNGRLHAGWRKRLEVVVPRPGDLRAVDEVITNGECMCAVEAVTRLADVQAQLRSAHAKQRDIGADRLILLIAATHANRRLLRECWPLIGAALPVDTRHAMVALARGLDPGGDCLVLL